jgi:hypothetical protein
VPRVKIEDFGDETVKLRTSKDIKKQVEQARSLSAKRFI